MTEYMKSFVIAGMEAELFTVQIMAKDTSSSPINGLYIYPKAVQERAYEIGLTDRETVKKRSFLALIWVIGAAIVAGLVVLLAKVI